MLTTTMLSATNDGRLSVPTLSPVLTASSFGLPLPYPFHSHQLFRVAVRCPPPPLLPVPVLQLGGISPRRAGAGRVEQRAKAWLGFWNLSLSSRRGAAVAGPQSLRIFRFYLPADTKASPGVRGRRAGTHGCAHTRTTAQRRAHLCIHTQRDTQTLSRQARAHSRALTRIGTRLRARARVDQLRSAAQPLLSGHAHAEPRTEPHTRAHTRTLHAPGGGPGAVQLQRRAGTRAGAAAAAATAEEAERGSRERAGPRSSWRPGIFQPGSRRRGPPCGRRGPWATKGHGECGWPPCPTRSWGRPGRGHGRRFQSASP